VKEIRRFLAPGTTLAHYEIVKAIGAGAIGTVYRAWDVSLQRVVAVKLLDPVLADDPSVVERFERESRAAARATHPNLVHVYFVGAQGEDHFYAMEFVPGESLDDRVRRCGPQDLAVAVDATIQAARGLARAHAEGIVHRDVKPANLLIASDGTVKVTDFGLAKAIGGEKDVTGAGTIVGTPLYMSPEACRERATDVRSDVYSLGLTMWFLLGGRPPFWAGSVADILLAQVSTPLPPVRPLRPDLPPAVDAVLARMCAKDPQERPRSMDEVIELLETLRPRRLVLAPAPFRAAAFAVDLLCVGTVEAALMYLVGETLGHGALAGWLDEVALTVAAAPLLLLVEARWGATLGKRLFRIGVLRDNGAAASLAQHVARFAVRFPVLLIPTPPQLGWLFAGAWALQALALALGAGWMAATRGISFADRVTRTRVAYLPSERGFEPFRAPEPSSGGADRAAEEPEVEVLPIRG
jgi:uncharacterized RDD family membrane protein YckC